MADEEMERGSPASTSEATPPHVDDSPEMVSQPSPPEEQRVSSSTDQQLPENADSPVDPSVSSTSEQELTDAAAEVSNRAPLARLLLQSNEASSAGGSPSPQSSADTEPEIEDEPQPDASPDRAIRRILEAPPVLPLADQPVQLPEVAGISPGLVAAGIERALSISNLGAATANVAADDQKGLSQEIAKEKFDIDVLTSASKSPKNIDLGSRLSPSSAGKNDGKGSSPKDVDLRRQSPSKIGDTKESGSPGKCVMEIVGLKSKLTPPKVIITRSNVPDKIGLGSHLSSQADAISEESALEKARESVTSPKRKSPTKMEHLTPKRCSPMKLQKPSDSMYTLLEDLDIKETETQQGCPASTSGQKQGMSSETKAALQNEETGMEVDETDDSELEQGATEKFSGKDDSELEESD